MERWSQKTRDRVVGVSNQASSGLHWPSHSFPLASSHLHLRSGQCSTCIAAEVVTNPGADIWRG